MRQIVPLQIRQLHCGLCTINDKYSELDYIYHEEILAAN